MSITDRINNNLQVLFNIEDPIYKALICDNTGNNPDSIFKPTDIDLGVFASQIEFLRRLSFCLAKQLFLTEASGEFLIYQLEEFFNSLRLEDETDLEWIQRTIVTVLQPKLSNASIIYSLRPYSSQEPEISNISTESAFADFCFADVYTSGSYTLPDSTVIKWLPAIAETFSSSFFTIKITLYNTATEDIWAVQNIIQKLIAAGISYILVIQYT